MTARPLGKLRIDDLESYFAANVANTEALTALRAELQRRSNAEISKNFS
jgi:hypothetical protein